MIKNERQYRITKAQADRFLATLQTLDGNAASDDLQATVERAALRAQYEDLSAELAEFDELRSGQPRVLSAPSLEELPHLLIKARIAGGLTQRDLATQLGVKEQQIQQYEATDYASASLRRLQEIADALGVTIREDLVLRSANPNLQSLLTRLRSVGIDRQFLLQRLLPRTLAARIEESVGESSTLAVEIGAWVGRLFSWSLADIFGSKPLRLDPQAISSVRFKVPARADPTLLHAYTVYAQYMAMVVLESTSDWKVEAIPLSAAEFRAAIQSRGSLDFRDLLEFVWDLGIPVLPLSDSGAFHAACWRVERRNAIVLKQRTRSSARWSFDLLHELRHAADDPTETTRAVIDDDENIGSAVDASENSAMDFAGDVLLAGRAEELAHAVVARAKKHTEWLKRAVREVADEQSVPVASLANYLAYRLSCEGTNWWAVANNLQGKEEDPWAVARDVFLRRVPLDRMNPSDRYLFERAMSNDRPQ